METAQNITPPNVSLSEIVEGKPLEIRGGFKATTFRHNDFKGAMDPLIMVDHFVMTAPTFGAHPHAGLSAVSVILEDSVGHFRNRDSLGNDFDLMPGDLYWLKAGSGIIHDESPRENAKTHGIQVFVNLPADLKHSEPGSLHVKAQDIPVIEQKSSRVRVVLGESNGIKSHASPALPMTILEGKIGTNGGFEHSIQPDESAWIYAMGGTLEIETDNQIVTLSPGQSIAISNESANLEHIIQITNASSLTSKFAMFVGRPIKEPFVQQGPFAMSTKAEIAEIIANYNAGKLGHLSPA